MTDDTHSQFETNPKNLFIGSVIFTAIIILAIFLAWRFSPSPLIFSEGFENAERNQQYLPCAAFTIVNGRLRVTVAESHSGCAVRLPNEFDNFTLTESVYPVQDIYDGSINILFKQNDDVGHEIQFRPNLQQVNYIETAKNAVQEAYIKSTTGWIQTPAYIFNNSENKIKLTVTPHSMELWFNNVLIFRNINTEEFIPEQGIIKIGAGAGEIGGIAFEYDNIEIHAERMYSTWVHDHTALEEIKNAVQ